MNRKGSNILSSAVVVAVVVALPLLPAAPAELRAVRVVVGVGGADGRPRPPQEDKIKPAILLINFDEEMGGYVEHAGEMIARKDYIGAIDILQAMLNRSEQCFVPTEDPRRFVSLAVKANEVIGQLPPDGMKLYRRLYDPRAERLFLAAAGRMDQPALRDLIVRYFHTSYGDDALNLLGAILFDGGRFSQAARCWREIIYAYNGGESTIRNPQSAILLSKMAVAHHFAGESARAAEAMGLLVRHHPQARAGLGGREENVVVFTRRMLAKTLSLAGPRLQEGWPSLAGSPDSVAVMGPCRPVLSPRWTTPGGKIKDNPNIKAALAAIPRASRRGNMLASVSLREGQVMVKNLSPRSRGRNPQGPQGLMAALIHPIVVGKTVLYRCAEGIVAHDLLTGEKAWETLAFSLNRSGSSGTRRYHVYSPGAVEDFGRWTLTAGDGKIFAVGGFIPFSTLSYYMAGGRNPGRSGDTSSLAAFSISGQGRLLWQVGSGEGTTDLARRGKFLTAPTYAAGRVYAVVEHMQAYYMVCLDSENGRTMWEALVGQTPLVSMRHNRYHWRSRGSPPAVADGRVFVTTNAGVIAAFDAETGRSLWAYQYESTGTGSGPPNPVIVTGGRMICLPADSKEVLAFRAETGRREWAVDRHGQRDLTAVDDSRLVLSGGEIRILDAITGREVWKADGVSGVHGRPAVTSEAILASGAGEIIEVSLSDFAVRRPPLVQADAILGNLICAGGKLLAANAAGISAYFTFEDARAELTGRIRTAGPTKVANLLYQRGMNAFNASRPSEALADLLSAHRKARSAGDSVLLAKSVQSLYRAYVSLADRATDSRIALGFYRKAQGYTYSDRSRGEMVVRLTKHYSRVGMPAHAAGLAQGLTVSHAKIDLADVKIGEAADPFVRDDEDTARSSGYELGHRLIKRLIESHGQGCYAAFDARARADLAAAVGSDDHVGMVRVTDMYRHSAHAPMALLRAAELCYRRGLRAGGKARREPLRLAGHYLGRIGREYGASGLATSARVGLAMVYEQINPRVVGLLVRGMADLPTDDKVAFAGVSGSLEEVMKRLTKRRLFPRPSPPALPGPISTPLAHLFAGSEPMSVLRRADGQAVCRGGCLFLLRGGRVSMFDPSAGSFKEATRWETPSLLDTRRTYSHSPGFTGWSYSLMAGLSSDSATLVLGSKGGFAGVNVKTGKVVWRRGVRDILVNNIFSMAIEDDRCVILTKAGAINVLEMRSGKELWKYQMNRVRRSGFSWHSAQISGGLLLTRHVYRGQWRAGVFDLTGGKLLGEIPLSRNGQACLTADGLVVVSDGRSLRLIEPILGITESIWSVALAAKLSPAILGGTDTHVLISPNVAGGVVELRSLADYGRIVRTFQTSPKDGRAAVPIWAEVVGNRLYMLVSLRPYGSLRGIMAKGRMYHCWRPILYQFDLTSGKALWSAELTPPGTRSNLYVMNVQVGRGHISVLVKETNYNRPCSAMIVEAATGRIVQKFSLPGAQKIHRLQRVFRHHLLSSPVITNGRLVVETHKGLEVYGKKS